MYGLDGYPNQVHKYYRMPDYFDNPGKVVILMPSNRIFISTI